MRSAMTAVHDYWQDAWQRSILFLDVLRERGNIYMEQIIKEVPHVLSFKVELVRDGRTLARPVNYALVRIIPPDSMKIDPAKAPSWWSILALATGRASAV